MFISQKVATGTAEDAKIDNSQEFKDVFKP